MIEIIGLSYTIKALLENQQIEARGEGSRIAIGSFECVAHGTTLTVTPTENFDSIESARATLEPGLRDWEAEWDLRGMPIEFQFSSAHALDESMADGATTHQIVAEDRVGVSESLSIKATVEFQPPTGEYRSNPTVDFLRFRWLSPTSKYKELPTSAAYALVTYLVSLHGSLEDTANRLNVSRSVLTTAKRLASQPDPEQGRKFSGSPRTLTPRELDWLSAVIRTVGKRAARVESGNEPGEMIDLGHSDLPKLP